jgi:hypothetical protein
MGTLCIRSSTFYGGLGSRSRDGVSAPPGAVYLLSTLVGDLHTSSRRMQTATRGGHAPSGRSSTPNNVRRDAADHPDIAMNAPTIIPYPRCPRSSTTGVLSP